MIGRSPPFRRQLFWESFVLGFVLALLSRAPTIFALPWLPPIRSRSL
jgi:hypothetical protein